MEANIFRGWTGHVRVEQDEKRGEATGQGRGERRGKESGEVGQVPRKGWVKDKEAQRSAMGLLSVHSARSFSRIVVYHLPAQSARFTAS